MKKNKIFINRINKKINNNQKEVDIRINNLNTIEKIKNNDDNLKVEEKLKKIFERNGYTFNVDVKIITNQKDYDTKIAGKVNDHIITLDNDIININDIKDIIIKN